MKDKNSLKEKFSSFFRKVSEGWNNLKKKCTPKFVTEYKEKKEQEILAIDVSRISKPVNDVATSGPKKMKDFSLWPGWKTALVGLIGVIAVIGIWWLYAYIAVDVQGGRSWLSSPPEVFDKFIEMCQNGRLWNHLWYSVQRILVGFLLACVTSIPIAFLMAWYKPVRAFFDPFVQFLRCIPPLAYVPIVVAAFAGGEGGKYFIIWLAVFLTMTVTIYQGVRNVDLTLVKAAYTFGAKDRNLFLGVIVPSAFPFILTAMRLGVGAAMTTLVAAEMSGTQFGLGFFINNQGNYLRLDYCIMGIIVLGLFGILLDKILLLIEKRLTRWK